MTKVVTNNESYILLNELEAVIVKISSMAKTSSYASQLNGSSLFFDEQTQKEVPSGNSDKVGGLKIPPGVASKLSEGNFKP